MARKGNPFIIVFDVGISMQKLELIDEDYESDFEHAQACARTLIEKMIYNESKDDVAIILIGSDNKIEEDTDEDYKPQKQDIHIFKDLQPAGWNIYESIYEIKCTNMSTDYIRHYGIEAAISLVQPAMDSKKIDSAKIYFLSNFDGYLYTDRWIAMCEEINNMNIELIFIGAIRFTDEEVKSEIASESETKDKCHALDILQEISGDSYIFSDFFMECVLLRMREFKSLPSNLPLEIGTLTIPVRVFIKIFENKTKPWKSEYVHGDGEKPKRITTYCMNDETQTRVLKEDWVYAYKYGTTLVPFSEDDKKNMDYQSGGKGMKVLGFTKASNVKIHTYIGNTTKYVYGQKNDESAQEALAAFIQALNDTDMVAIVRFVPTPRSAPVIGFLYPKITKNSECLVLITLPYMEDIRHFVFTSLDSDSNNIPSDEQLDAIDQLITSMDLTVGIDGIDGDDICDPGMMSNPYANYLFDCLTLKAIQPKEPLPLMQSYIFGFIEPLPPMLQRAETSLKNIKSLFPMKESLKKTSETESHLFPLRESEEAATKNLENEDDPETKVNVPESILIDAMTDKISMIQSINPVGDIRYLINHQVLTFDKICEQINGLVNKFVNHSSHLIFHDKILSVLKEYRCVSLKKAKCEKYNVFMLYLQDHLLEKDVELWNKIRNEKIGLISNVEMPSSSISSEKAEKYLSRGSVEDLTEPDFMELNPLQIISKDDDDDDDLMDQL